MIKAKIPPDINKPPKTMKNASRKAKRSLDYIITYKNTIVKPFLKKSKNMGYLFYR